jgi:N-acetylneuraminic acid mutarotase
VKKQSTSQSAFLGLRFSIIFVLSAAVGCSILTGTVLAFFRSDARATVSHRTLTFAERVSYQRAIEEIYWRHRIWPKERCDPKPPLDAVMSQAQLEKKVANYLRNSQALEDYLQRRITAEQLQAEMDRMAQHSKQPEVLRELFAVLGDDPFVIAECLARPALVERLLAHPALEQVKKTSRTFGPIETTTASYALPTILYPTGGCADDTWTATSLVNAPTARASHTAVWTGNEMIVWGGIFYDGQTNYFLNTGGRYNPATDTWASTSMNNAPTGRINHTAVWTGSEMIIWGGYYFDENVQSYWLNTGGRYNPVMDEWTATSTTNVPSERRNHTAVWTGGEMIVWGGSNGGGAPAIDTGGRYNPSLDNWEAISMTNAPSARELHTAVWTGSEMIVWGGLYFPTYLNTGGRYNPSTNAWAAASTTNAPSAREFHTAVWIGSEMIVCGGEYGWAPLNDGARYNPNTNTWAATGTMSDSRYLHTAVWTGSEMIVWGGAGDTNFWSTGGRYHPATDSWTLTSTLNTPAARSEHTAVWTGSEMIVWGGQEGWNYFNSGGIYCAQMGPTPRPIPTPRPRPSPRPRL